MVKVRDGQVANRPFYAAIGVTLDGENDVLRGFLRQGRYTDDWLTVAEAGLRAGLAC